MRGVFFVGVIALLSSPVTAADRLCGRLHIFAAARFTADVRPEGRRWIELHWRGHWMDFDSGWGFSCLHSPDQTAVDFCRWLTDNTSFEFPTMLPKAILRCYGYAFPDADSWTDWKAAIGLDRDARSSLLEVNLGLLAAESGAIRFSTFQEGYDPAKAELPPIQPMTELPRK